MQNQRDVVTLSITFLAEYNTAFDYLSNPLNQKEWAVHFVKDMVQTEDGFLATLPFGKLPFKINSDQSSGMLDIIIGDGRPTRSRLIEIEPGFCTYNFTLVQPQDMPKTIWVNEGLPNMKAELEILKTKLEIK